MPAYQNLYQNSMWGGLPYNPLGIPSPDESRRNPFGMSNRSRQGTVRQPSQASYSSGTQESLGVGETVNQSRGTPRSSASERPTIYNPTSYSSVTNPNSELYGHTTNPNYVPNQTPRMGPMPPRDYVDPMPSLSISTHPPRNIDYGALDYGALQRNIKAQEDWKAEWAAAIKASREQRTRNIREHGPRGIIMTGHRG